MPSENYDFVPWDSPDDIHKFFNPDDIEKFAPLVGLLTRVGATGAANAVTSQGVMGAMKTGLGKVGTGLKNKLGTGLKNIKAKVGVKGGGAATEAVGAAEGATSAAKTATSATEAVESVAPKPSLPKASDGTESVPLPETPAAEPAVETPEPEESSGGAGQKPDWKKQGMQMASQMQAQSAQRKQAQEQRAMDMARRGASVQTGEPMDIAMRLLKDDRDTEIYELAQEAMALGLADNWADAMDIARQEAQTGIHPGNQTPGVHPAAPELAPTRQYFPTTLVHEDATEGIQRRVNPFTEEGTFEGLPFKDDFRRSESMDIAMRLLKLEAYESEHPVGIKTVHSSPNISEGCTLCPNPKALISLRYTNPTYTKDYTHHMCYDCAEQYDVHDMIHPAALEGTDVKLAGNPMDIAYQLLKNWEGHTDMHSSPRNFNEYFGVKDSWVSLPKEGMDARPQLYDEVASAMNTAYEPVGGHAKYKNADDLQGEAKHARYDMIDNDKDPYVDAARVFSQQEQGFKASITAHDGQTGAKRAVVDHMVDHMQMPGHYGEFSGAWPRILDKKGLQPIEDYQHIQELVNRPLRETETGPGTYTRRIGEKDYEKQIFGTPMREGAQWTNDFMQQATDASRNNSALFLDDYNFPKSDTQ